MQAGRVCLYSLLQDQNLSDLDSSLACECVLIYIRMLGNMGTEMSEKPVIKQYVSVVSCISTCITFRS